MAKKTFLDEVLEKFGDDIQIREYPDGHPTIPTGSLALDISTGIGGIPVGRYTEIYGAEQGGKSTICLCIAREALKLGGKVLYLDVENNLDHTYALGILGEYHNPDKFQILQPYSGEDAYEIAEMAIDNNYSLIIFDSVGALSPEKELEGEMDEQQVGLAPRLTSKFLRKTNSKVRTNETTFVFTNQVRANIGSYMGGFTTPAGLALKHYTSLRIMLSKGKEIKGDGDSTVGIEVNFVIKKNKLAVPYRSAATNIIFKAGIDHYWDVIKFGSLLGVIKVRGSYFVFDEQNLGQGVEKASQFLRENPGTLDKIEKMCYNITGMVKEPVRLAYE